MANEVLFMMVSPHQILWTKSKLPEPWHKYFHGQAAEWLTVESLLIPFYFLYCRFKTICEWESDFTMRHHPMSCDGSWDNEKGHHFISNCVVWVLSVEIYPMLANLFFIHNVYHWDFDIVQFLTDLRFTGDCAGEVCKWQNRCNYKWMSSSGYKTNLRQSIFAKSLSLYCLLSFFSFFFQLGLVI